MPCNKDRAIRALLLLSAFAVLLSAFAFPSAQARRAVRHRRQVRRIALPPVTRAQAAQSTAAPAAEPVRSVILFVANGYGADDWQEVRAARADGLLARDRMPVTGVAMLPDPIGRDTSAALARLVGVGEPATDTDQALEPVMAYAKRAGKSLGLVGSASVADPLPAFLAASAVNEDPADTLRRLAVTRVDVLFGRSAPADGPAPLSTYGYRTITDPEALLMAESTPLAAAVPADSVPYDTLFFRALHLVAKNGRGFMIGAGADPRRVRPAELDAALAAAVRFARADRHTLVLMVDRDGDGPATIYAEGASAAKFSGTLAATDIPKILSGVMGLRGFRRDFSPFFTARAQGGTTRAALDTPAGATGGPGRTGLSLPW